MNMKYQRNPPPPPPPPPPHFLIRSVLLCFLLIAFLAVPVQSQSATQTPAAPARLTNPTSVSACGLPTTWARFNASATVTTFNMTADCAFNGWNVENNAAFLYFTAGEFTINGNGHSIIGPSNTWTLYVQNNGTILNLNNVTIRGNNGAATVVTVTSGARLNARGVIFRDNATTGPALLASGGSEVHLDDAQFLKNRVANETGIVSLATGASIVITKGIFRKNRADISRIINVDTAASFSGSSITFSDDNSARTLIEANEFNSRVTLRNVQFLNNRQTSHTEPRGSAVTSREQALVTITNGIFRGNRNVAGQTDVITTVASSLDPVISGKVNLQGCITFANNVQSDGSTAANDYTAYGDTGNYVSAPLTGRITDSRTGGCPANFGLGSKKKAKKAEPRPTATSTPRPAYGASYVALQTATGMTFEATYGLDSGVHFRQLDGAGIGIQSIIDAGHLTALDVYGYVEQGVEVCFPQIGRVIFLDARTMPRAIVPLEATVRDGMTCVSISSPGSLVLMPN